MVRSGANLAVVGLASLITGCANLENIHYTDNLDVGASVTTDASQRVIVNTPANRSGNGNRPARIVCAEPSPDVAQAISEAIKAGLSADVSKASPGGYAVDAKVAAEFGRSTSVSIAQLGERLAAIQLLRDKMYRACEAYANGAVNATGYTLMLARLDKTMVTMLSNELTAGAFGRALASIGGNATVSGVSAAELEAQSKKVRDKVDVFAAVKADKKPDAEVAAASKSVDDELAKLLLIERLSAGLSVSASAGSPGSISNLSRTSELASIATIHKNYIDDDGVEPLVDACITSMDNVDLRQFTGYKERIDAQLRADEAMYRKERDSKIDEINIEIGKLSEDLADLNARFNENDKGSPFYKMNMSRRSVLLSRLDQLNKRKEDIVKQSSSDAGKKVDDEIYSLYVSSGNAFPAFCLRNVFSKEFTEKRMSAKQDLRKLTVDFQQGAALEKAVSMCGDVLSGKITLPDAQKKDFADSCKKVIGKIGGP